MLNVVSIKLILNTNLAIMTVMIRKIKLIISRLLSGEIDYISHKQKQNHDHVSAMNVMDPLQFKSKIEFAWNLDNRLLQRYKDVFEIKH